jgi:hypothetical protein
VILLGYRQWRQMGQPPAAPLAAGNNEASMPQPNTLTSDLRDLCDDALYHMMNLVHGAFDLTCVVAVAALVFASGLEPARLVVPEVQARVIKTCPVMSTDCISAAVLAPLGA